MRLRAARAASPPSRREFRERASSERGECRSRENVKILINSTERNPSLYIVIHPSELSEPKVERERRGQGPHVVPPPLRYEQRIVRRQHADETLPCRVREFWKLFQIRRLRVDRRELIARPVPATCLVDVETRVANLRRPQPDELVPAHLAQHVVRLVRVQVRHRPESSCTQNTYPSV